MSTDIPGRPDGENPTSPRGSALFGHALDALRVRRTPAGRRAILLRSQVPFMAALTLVLAACLIAESPGGPLPVIVACWGVLAATTVVLWFTPWQRRAEVVGLIVSFADLIAVGLITAVVIDVYPGFAIMVGFPVVVLAFAMGIAGLVAAIVGTLFVALYPPIVTAREPSTAAGWLDLALFPLVVILVAVVVFVGSGLLQRVQGRLSRTIGEREAATLASENQRAVVMTVLDAMDVGTAFVDNQGDLNFTNVAFRSLIDRSVIDPATRSGTKVYDTDRVTPLGPNEQMMAQAARGEYFDSRMYWIGDPGDQRAMLVTARPVVNHEGELIGSAFVSKDVTDLTDAIRAREEFLAGVSHELRTPLTSIIGYLEVIEDSIDLSQVDIGRELAIIQRNADQLMMRIGDLLHVADDSVTLRLRAVDVPTIVRQATDAILIRARDAGIEVETSLAGPFVASIDPNRFSQVIDNLLTNAVKYTGRGGTVRIDLWASESSFTVSVTDTGMGIDLNDQRHVFDRFFRTEAARDGSVAGAGLGLAIVKSIVHAHGGTIDVTSRVGLGSTFTVTIPR